MTTKQQFIQQAKAANPQPQYATINGEQVELSDDEYEASIEAWAEMMFQQEQVALAAEAAEQAKASATAKLAALGLTDEEVSALLGG